MAGFSAVGTDLLTYAIFLKIMVPSASKALSFVCATCVAYLLNKFWTFKMKTHSWHEMSKFFGLYGTTLIFNIIVNKMVLEIVPRFIPSLSTFTFQLAWLAATGVSTVMNYLGQKYWVFKIKTSEGA